MKMEFLNEKNKDYQFSRLNNLLKDNFDGEINIDDEDLPKGMIINIDDETYYFLTIDQKWTKWTFGKIIFDEDDGEKITEILFENEDPDHMYQDLLDFWQEKLYENYNWWSNSDLCETLSENVISRIETIDKLEKIVYDMRNSSLGSNHMINEVSKVLDQIK